MPTLQKAQKMLAFFGLGGRLGSSHLRYRVLTGTSHATPGTTVNVPHGLGYAPDLRFVRRGNGYITAVDAVNVTIASAAASQALEIVVIEQD